jgi:hypothetical protein
MLKIDGKYTNQIPILLFYAFFAAKEFAGQSRHSGWVAALFLMLLQA